MDISSLVKPYGAEWLTSERRLGLKRTVSEWGRRLARRDHEIIYFHRADDPYCQLMVQILPDLMARFNVKICPRVVERLPANMYPDPARYEAYSILDATRLARLYGLGFPARAQVPDRLGVGMANRYLASKQADPAFFTLAEEIGAALWREDLGQVKRLCVIADIDDALLAGNEQLLRSFGYYASGSLVYGGEIYSGLDRIDHLEKRLNRLGLGDGEVHFELGRLWRYGMAELDRSVSGKTVELFFSVRSPYSYIGLHLASEFADMTGVQIKLKPVLPMLMRGLQVPAAKARYILADAAREARAEGLPFGRIADPLGAATKRAMGIGFALAGQKLNGVAVDLAFFKSFTRAVWAEGVDGSTDKGLRQILRDAGLASSVLENAMETHDWQEKAERNRQQMLMYGSWGVPTFRIGNETLWGQDRLWAVAETLKQGHSD